MSINLGLLSTKGRTGYLEWYVHPADKHQHEFIERTAIELARKEGFDRIAIRSNVHNTTRVGYPGSKVRIGCDWHYTADFYDSDTGFWKAAHVLTDTVVVKLGPELDLPDLVHSKGLSEGVENPEYYPAGRFGHFRPPAVSDRIYYSLDASSENNEVREGEITLDYGEAPSFRNKNAEMEEGELEAGEVKEEPIVGGDMVLDY